VAAIYSARYRVARPENNLTSFSIYFSRIAILPDRFSGTQRKENRQSRQKLILRFSGVKNAPVLNQNCDQICVLPGLLNEEQSILHGVIKTVNAAFMDDEIENSLIRPPEVFVDNKFGLNLLLRDRLF
jgi:hypothetical protein